MPIPPDALRCIQSSNYDSRQLNRWLLPAFLILAISGNASGADGKPVVVADVVELEIRLGQSVVGTVRPLRTSTIGSAVSGRVLEFLVDEGEAVQKGQPLARLRTSTLMIELEAAKAESRLYDQQLAELKNGSRAEDKAEARANASAAKAAMESALTQLRRMKSLVASRATSEVSLDEARERAEFTRHTYAASKALLKRIETGNRPEQIAQAVAQVDLQSEKIRLIEDRMEKYTIRAPFDGFVSAEFTEVGAWISQADPIATVIQLDEVEVQASVTAASAVQLRRGDTARIDVRELPDVLLTGTVDRIVPVAEDRARTFPTFIRLKNQIRDGTPALMAGMMARVELPAGRKEIMPLVPKDALVLNAERRSIYVVQRDDDARREGTVRQVAVELGIAVDARVQVRGDVRAGEQVVVVGNERLRDGDRVVIQEEPVERQSQASDLTEG